MDTGNSWIWARLRQLTSSAERLFITYQYGEAGRQIYDFFWGEFADWYLEVAKIQVAEGGPRAKRTAVALVKILDRILRLLHPFAPFITEELWGFLKQAAQSYTAEAAPTAGWEDALIIASWPEPEEIEGWEDDAIGKFSLVMDITRSIRNLRAEKQVTPSHRIGATITAGDHSETLRQQSAIIAALCHLNPTAFQIFPSLENKPEGTIALVVGPAEIFLPLSDLIDPVEEKKRLLADLEENMTQIERLENLLSSPFAQKAPPEVVRKERDRLASVKETAEKIQSQLKELG